MINLTKKCTSFERLNIGASKKYKLTNDGNEYYFKENYFEYEQDIIEVFVTQILEKINFKDFVKYELARFDNADGCYCKSYKTKDFVNQICLSNLLCANYQKRVYNKTNPIDYEYAKEDKIEVWESFDNYACAQYDYTCNQIVEEVQEYCRGRGIEFDGEKIYDRLCELVVLDYFLANGDRHWGNLMFVLNKDDQGKQTMVLSPVFDNGESFAFNSSTVKEYNDIKRVVLNIGISDIGKKEDLAEHNYLKNGGLTIVDIYECARQSENIKNLVDAFLSIDIDAEIKSFVKREDVPVSVEITNQIRQTFKDRQNRYKKIAARLDRKLEKANKFSEDLEK